MKKNFLIACLLGVSSCRLSKVGKENPDQNIQSGDGNAASSKPPVVQPQRQSDKGVELAVHLDESGQIIEALTLRLDYFPSPRTDGASIPTCYDEFPGHLVIGRLFCSKNGNIAMDITASQVAQQCYTGSPLKRFEAKSKIILTGCQGGATLRSIHYEPDIKLEMTK